MVLSIMMKKYLLLDNVTISRQECKNHILFITKMTEIDTHLIYDQNISRGRTSEGP